MNFKKSQEDYIDFSEITPHSNCKTAEGRELAIEWGKIIKDKKRKQVVAGRQMTPDKYFGSNGESEEPYFEPEEKQRIMVLKHEVLQADDDTNDPDMNCSKCMYEIYLQYQEGDEAYNYRDCMNISPVAQEFFKKSLIYNRQLRFVEHEGITETRDIEPLNCPFCKEKC